MSASDTAAPAITQWGVAGAITISGAVGTPAMAASVPSSTIPVRPAIPAAPAPAVTTSTRAALQRVSLPTTPTIIITDADESAALKPLIGPVLGDIRRRRLRRQGRNERDMPKDVGLEGDEVPAMSAENGAAYTTEDAEQPRPDLVA
jgi:hypothetical protein